MVKFKLIEPVSLTEYIPVIRDVKFHDIDESGEVVEEQTLFLQHCAEYTNLLPYEENDGVHIWHQKIAYLENTVPRFTLYPVGITGWYSYPPVDKNRMWLSWFGIRDEFQRKGYGTLLLQQTIDLILQEYDTIDYLYLFTAGAPLFYEKCGFERLGVAEDLVASGHIEEDATNSPKEIVFRKKIK